MNRFQKFAAVFALAVFGLWGCARAPEANSSRVKSDDKIAKIEDELRVAQASKDQYRKRLNAVEEAMAQTRLELQQESEKLLATVKEREELKGALKQRTVERDRLQTQYDGFRKGLRELLAQAEATLPLKAEPAPATTLSETAPMPREITATEEPSGPALR